MGFYRANQVDTDDISVTTPEGQNFRLHTLRQQVDRDQENYVAMADFVAPEGIEDYIGMFAVSAGFQ